ncbi:MAG: hypothetical protein CVU65_07330, partial [Deltaproteobacteria bacterium HGW-Deltaproteobacteria-22]
LLGLRGGTLACDQYCRFDTTACDEQAGCGDGTVQENHDETCDGDNLGGHTCQTMGYHGGTLACRDDCTLDLTSCEATGRCDDGIIQFLEFEECDGDNLNGTSCAGLGYHSGELVCGDDCRFDTTACEAAGRCGDGIIQEAFAEQCDGAALDGQTCVSLNYYGGQLTCGPACTFDVTNCALFGRCGDGLIQSAHEACDGANLNELTCESLGWTGTLACSGTCILDTTGCH